MAWTPRYWVSFSLPPPLQNSIAHSPRTPWFCHSENYSLSWFPWNKPGFIILQLSKSCSLYWSPLKSLLFCLCFQFYLHLKLDQQRGNVWIQVSKSFFYSLHWQVFDLLNCIPLKSKFFSETTIVFSFLLKSISHNELVIKAESSGENNKYWRSPNKITAHKIQLLLAFIQPAGTQWCKWPEAFARTMVNAWSLKSEL